ncbi:hypothetical protein RIF29_28390 [Crotalaria pallida]|uniref:Uncharacterized protein n=1 Tax=Crotalaria pallida TaxID=3830 RepID=A0AAN9ECW5_CROPI
MVSQVCVLVINGGEALTTGFTNSVAYYGEDHGSALVEVVRVWVKLDDVSQKHDGGVNQLKQVEVANQQWRPTVDGSESETLDINNYYHS